MTEIEQHFGLSPPVGQAANARPARPQSSALRHVTAVVLFDPAWPPQTDSTLDVALLRAAHQAFLRKDQGVQDAFLFVVVSNLSFEKISEGFERYGFPGARVCAVSSPTEDGKEISLSDDCGGLRASVGFQVEQWVNEHHRGAITDLAGTLYGGLDTWWRGIEAADEEFSWPFEVKHFAGTLPETHSSKAATWLAVLRRAAELEEPENWSAESAVAFPAATLCEWLHGFEAACGNGYNHFEASATAEALNIDPFVLGYALSSYFPSLAISEIGDEHASVDDAKAQALLALTADNRGWIRDALSTFFGGDTPLYWALHTAIWPSFERPMGEACSAHTGLEDVEYPDVGEAWMFVADGWSDSATD